MRLLRYHLCKIAEGEWDFEDTTFGRINLLVGDSGTGKTRFLNTIINFFIQLVADKVKFDGDWDIDFEINDKKYNYKLVVERDSNTLKDMHIKYESFCLLGSDKLIFLRENNKIIWEDKELPKLSSEITCFSLMKNEEIINPIYSDMKRIIARRFSGDELSKSFQLGALMPDVVNNIVKTKDKALLSVEQIDFHNKMDILRKIDRTGYSKVVELIKSAFPFLTEVDVLNISQVLPGFPVQIQTPVFCIKEKNIAKWIPCNDISSGMQKLFLLILDTYLLKDSGILLIDEYENSLGINAINFLPDLINSISENCQFIITSHHPYIVNNIPIESWRVFHRNGMIVKITSGKILKEKYSKSKQEYFVQLINDPIYSGGVE